MILSTVDPLSLQQMRDSKANKLGTIWHAYQNQDLGHVQQGLIQFLAVGPENTVTEPGETMPDTGVGLGWRWRLIGVVDLESGVIVPKQGRKS